MRLVIDIPKHIYEHAKEKSEDSNDEWDAMRAIADGKPLPKRHGDLIDRDTIEVLRIGNIKREYDKGFDAGVTCMVNRILEAPTIIEADKESESE